MIDPVFGRSAQRFATTWQSIMKLTGTQQERLRDAILSGFPQMSNLEQLTTFNLDVTLSAIVNAGSDLGHVVFQLIRWAEAYGRTEDLIRAARKERPRNADIQAIARDLLVTRVAISGSIQAGCGDWSVFCKELGRALARDGYSLFSGLSNGVGKPFYDGAIEHLKRAKDPDILSKCTAVHIGGEREQRGETRESLFKGIDACVFVSGKDGTRTEYKILKQQGVFLIPVGASGGTARDVWEDQRAGLLQEKDASRASLILRLGQSELQPADYVRAVQEILASAVSGG